MISNTEIERISIESRVLKAAARFMKRHEYELLDTVDDKAIKPLFNYVFRDLSGTVIFVAVDYTTNADEEMPLIELDRAAWESKVAAWLVGNAKKHDICDVPLRADTVGIQVLCGDRALIRHHINALALDTFYEDETESELCKA